MIGRWRYPYGRRHRPIRICSPEFAVNLLELEEWDAAFSGHVPSIRPYLNAQDAAERYILLRDRLCSVPVSDPSRPIVQTSPSFDAPVDALNEKMALQKAFEAVEGHPGINRPMCEAWYRVRIARQAQRSVRAKKGSVHRWLRVVDAAVDRELERRGMLACDAVRFEAQRQGYM